MPTYLLKVCFIPIICLQNIDSLEGFGKIERPKKFFTRGRIFKAVWIETAGPTTRDFENTTTVRYGQTAYTDIRRFVVIRKKEDCCICAPIHTFGGRGGGKRSTRRQDYALVFDTGKVETWDRERLSKKEIPIIAERDDFNISYPQARIQFGKLYTVEFFTLVQQLGYVHKEALDTLEELFLESIELSFVEGHLQSNTETAANPMNAGVDVPVTSSVLSRRIKKFGKMRKDASTEMNSMEQSPNLESSFRRYPEDEFKIGGIFKILWFEPHGADPDSVPYSSIRRFLIIREPREKIAGYCICLPISTNGGQGTLHHRARAKDYALIYTDTKENKLLAGETVTKKPIKVLLYNAGEKLEPTSRLNYGKLYTVECNLPVAFIGKVDPQDLSTVLSDFNSVNFDQKVVEDQED